MASVDLATALRVAPHRIDAIIGGGLGWWWGCGAGGDGGAGGGMGMFRVAVVPQNAGVLLASGPRMV
jgi:hypothetical protein